MLFVVSPAKNLDYETPSPIEEYSQPTMLDDSAALIKICRKLSPQDIASLMKISDKLAGLNAARFAHWQPPFDEKNAKQAVFAFNGDVYAGLDAASLSEKDWEWGQEHMRILSGLYGVLRPLDLMQPYRLEMGTKLKNPRGKNLYDFWCGRITEKLNETIHEVDAEFLVNLASTEYFKAVRPDDLHVPVVTPIFKDTKNGKVKIISFYAKKARGMMARYIIAKRANSVEDLKSFNEGGYRFSPEQSTGNELVFVRDEIK
ncbi:peroxide stress protein YaaA [Aliidiomarina sanyensis]|uniref:UPF0246 protein CWE11_10245 n=1 Tax=Aliidiomarina sanyensis TaxID=1249555 RepID=A0A432WBR0_9GAMM|nr:peroxide stress protein YaaA [Aliidiomarina sanyensis]RUO29125.1 peroxide stress protein YaaA [Aliidiomarina sanyensis]